MAKRWHPVSVNEPFLCNVQIFLVAYAYTYPNTHLRPMQCGLQSKPSVHYDIYSVSDREMSQISTKDDARATLSSSLFEKIFNQINIFRYRSSNEDFVWKSVYNCFYDHIYGRCVEYTYQCTHFSLLSYTKTHCSHGTEKTAKLHSFTTRIHRTLFFYFYSRKIYCLIVRYQNFRFRAFLFFFFFPSSQLPR